MKFVENHKALMIAGSLIVTFACGCVAGTAGMQQRMESGVAAAAEQKAVDGREDTGQQDVYQIDEDTLAKNCLESADYYLKNMPDVPLLAENADPELAGYIESSLEICINDVNATDKAGNIIRQLCREIGIDANKATVKDLTKEQIAQIDMETFRQSEHGKQDILFD